MPDMVLKKPDEYSWIRYIKQRIEKNKNFLCFVGGQTGSGKSWSAISICQMLDSDFNIDRIVFTGRELMHLINSGNLKKGSCVLFDESGIDLNNRNWQSTLNKMLNYLLQTFRHKCIILFMTSPYMDFIDAGTRKLMHAEFEMVSIDTKEEKAKLKPKLIQYNGKLAKYYYKYLKVITGEGVIPVTTWSIPKPTQEIIDHYETKKTEFTSALNTKIEQELEKIEGKEALKPPTDKQLAILDLLKQGKPPLEIAQIQGIHERLVYVQIEYLRKKGYSFEPIKEGQKVLSYVVKDPKNKV